MTIALQRPPSAHPKAAFFCTGQRLQVALAHLSFSTALFLCAIQCIPTTPFCQHGCSYPFSFTLRGHTLRTGTHTSERASSSICPSSPPGTAHSTSLHVCTSRRILNNTPFMCFFPFTSPDKPLHFVSSHVLFLCLLMRFPPQQWHHISTSDSLKLWQAYFTEPAGASQGRSQPSPA